MYSFTFTNTMLQQVRAMNGRGAAEDSDKSRQSVQQSLNQTGLGWDLKHHLVPRPLPWAETPSTRLGSPQPGMGVNNSVEHLMPLGSTELAALMPVGAWTNTPLVPHGKSCRNPPLKTPESSAAHRCRRSI